MKRMFLVAGPVAALVIGLALWATPAGGPKPASRGESFTITVPDLKVIAISEIINGKSFSEVVQSYMCDPTQEPLLKEVGTRPGAAIYRVTLSRSEATTINHSIRNCASSIKDDYLRSLKWWEQFTGPGTTTTPVTS
jgi:hypothetical protein